MMRDVVDGSPMSSSSLFVVVVITRRTSCRPLSCVRSPGLSAECDVQLQPYNALQCVRFIVSTCCFDNSMQKFFKLQQFYNY